jgi:riboflavin kinase/FMN adenylyltransferase
MLFQSKQIKGKGRGHAIGIPTINLEIPPQIELDEGIYAAWVVIDNKTYKGALHYGHVPTFNEHEKTMEVYLLDVTDDTVPSTKDIEIEVDTVEYLREIQNFAEVEDMLYQIALDVEKVNDILK